MNAMNKLIKSLGWALYYGGLAAIGAVVVIVTVYDYVTDADAQYVREREYVFKLMEGDLRVLDAAINKAPLPREATDPLVRKLQQQIVEQNRKAAQDKTMTLDANGNHVKPEAEPKP